MQTRADFLATGLVPVLSKLPATTEDCSICFNEMDDPVQTPCKHIYCKSCISTWLEGDRRNTCPLCKAVLFALSEAETLTATDRRRMLVARALERSNIITRQPPFQNFGSTQWTVSSVQRAAAMVTHAMNQGGIPSPGSWVHEYGVPGALAQVAGPCIIDSAFLAGAFVAMANMLPALADVQGHAFTAEEEVAWSAICETVWLQIERWSGRKSDAMILSASLRERAEEIMTKEKGSLSATEASFLARDGRKVHILMKLLDWVAVRAWIHMRELEDAKAKRAETKRLRQEAREEPKMETKCAMM